MQTVASAVTVAEILAELETLGSEVNRAGMARFGINAERAYGVSVGNLRKLRRRCGKSHELAIALWATERHEARILAGMVEDPAAVTAAQMDAWVAAFDSWDLCDQTCLNLFVRLPLAWKKAMEWSRRRATFEKRAGFSLMAVLAVHDKGAADAKFLRLLPLIEKQSGDDRNFVRKSVNWALRQIGKRNEFLRGEALQCAERVLATGTRSGRWIARDAMRELSAR